MRYLLVGLVLSDLSGMWNVKNATAAVCLNMKRAIECTYMRRAVAFSAAKYFLNTPEPIIGVKDTFICRYALQ